MKKKFAIIAAALAAFALSGCVGNSYNAGENWACVKAVAKFNTDMRIGSTETANQWINAILGFFPGGICYGFAGFLDVIVFNSINFWTGDNPLAVTEVDGVEYQLAKTSDTTATLTNMQTGESVDVVYNAETQACSVAL